MNRLPIVFVVALSTIHGATATLAGAADTRPFKLGMFEHEGEAFPGIVLEDALVIDLPTAHAALPRSTSDVEAPADMKALIASYEAGLRERIVEIVRAVDALEADGRPDYVHDIDELETLPPILYPTTMVNAAVNYREHGEEMEGVRDAGIAAPGTPGVALPDTASAPGIWERSPDDERWNPYMFMKSPAVVIAHEDAIRLPPGRSRIDWECEMGVVVGSHASRLSLEEAQAHIFGYTIENDVSDRGGRGDDRYGSDWLISKSHDSFAPLGPFILPKEFVDDPQDLDITFHLNGELMQDASTSLMIHDVFELLVYASNILTLRPGDVIATGTPAGVGSARNPPVYLEEGDLAACSYEGIGTLENPVVGPQDR